MTLIGRGSVADPEVVVRDAREHVLRRLKWLGSNQDRREARAYDHGWYLGMALGVYAEVFLEGEHDGR